MQIELIKCQRKCPMKTKITIDDDLLARAKQFSGISENPQLVKRALEYIVAYEKALLRAEEMQDFGEVGRTVQRLYDKIEPE